MYWNFLQFKSASILKLHGYGRSHSEFIFRFGFLFKNATIAMKQPQQISIWKTQSQTHKSLDKCFFFLFQNKIKNERKSLLVQYCVHGTAVSIDASMPLPLPLILNAWMLFNGIKRCDYLRMCNGASFQYKIFSILIECGKGNK